MSEISKAIHLMIGPFDVLLIMFLRQPWRNGTAFFSFIMTTQQISENFQNYFKIDIQECVMHTKLSLVIICGYVYRNHIFANSIMFLEQSSSKNVFYISISIAL